MLPSRTSTFSFLSAIWNEHWSAGGRAPVDHLVDEGPRLDLVELDAAIERWMIAGQFLLGRNQPRTVPSVMPSTSVVAPALG